MKNMIIIGSVVLIIAILFLLFQMWRKNRVLTGAKNLADHVASKILTEAEEKVGNLSQALS
jgi:hypothetical protein